MPIDELLVLAGKKSETTSMTNKVAEVFAPVVKSVSGKERMREATPAADEQDEVWSKGEKPKGWLGGWFGRG